MLYFDGQFDDARLLVNLAQTADEHGAVLLNYARVNGVSTAGGRVDGVVVRDEESGEELRLGARAVINATGAFADGIRKLVASTADPMIAPSQGAHVVLDRSFLPGAHGAHGAEGRGWPRDVCDPLARPHAHRYDRHADPCAAARAAGAPR